MIVPRPRTDIAITINPAIKPKTGIASIPFFAMTGISTTVIAPVGPLT